MLRARSIMAALCVAACGSLALALEGTVVDPGGRPIAGARACYVAGNVELMCSSTDDHGRFTLPTSQQDTLRIMADGYFPRLIAAASAVAPIALEPSPALLVRLLEAGTGEPLGEGEVSVVYSSGHTQGPFPVNQAGVRVRRVLKPGDVRLVATAPGYVQRQEVSIRLEGGKEAEVAIELERIKPD